MKPPPFAYAAPVTLEEAVGLLTEHAEAEPRVLAGGQSLIPLMNFRLAKPGYLVDLRNVAGLSGIRRDGDILVIGAMTRMSEVERSPEVAVAAPLLAEAIGLVAHAPVRNSGTVGGSLAHADPAAELPAVALALDAELVAAGPGGTRDHPGRGVLRGTVQHGPGAGRDPDRGPAAGVARRARVHRVLPGSRQLRRRGRGRAGRAGRRTRSGARPWPWRAWPRPPCGRDQPNGPWLVLPRPMPGRSGPRPHAAAADLSPAGDLHASAETRRGLARTYLRRGIELAVSRARNER